MAVEFVERWGVAPMDGIVTDRRGRFGSARHWELSQAGDLVPKGRGDRVELSLDPIGDRVRVPHTPPAAPVDAVARAHRALDLAIADELKANPKLTHSQAYALALQKNPALYVELHSGGPAAPDTTALDMATGRVRVEQPHLSQAQAMCLALERDPALYRPFDTERPAAASGPPPPMSAIDRATDRELAAQPGLTRAAAMALALSKDPSLYEAYDGGAR